MKRFFTLTAVFFSITLAFAQHGSKPSTEGASETPQIHWLTFEEAYELHQTEPKKWVIDVSTSWCGWCKRMDATTFSDSLVIEHVNENFYAVALDGEYKKEIKIEDRSYNFVAEGRRGYHELPAELMGGKLSYPTVVFLGEELQNLSAIPGYRGPKDFLQIVEFFEVYDVDDNPITWADFVKTYESPYPEEEEVETSTPH